MSKRRQTRKMSVEDALQMAVELHQRGLLDEAKSLYMDVLRTVPEQPDALHYLGVLSHQTGDSKAGVEYIKRSLKLNADQPDALNNLGNIYRELGRLNDAKTAYNQVLDFAPEHADTLVNVAVILRQLSQPQKALDLLNRAIKLSPEHGDAYHNLGNALADLGDYEEALSAYKKSLKYSSIDGLTPKAIARVQYDLGRTDDAIRTLQRWVFASPDDAVARHLLAAFKGENIPKRASDECVRQTFDGFSKTFDEVLDRLDYKAPGLVGDLVTEKLDTKSAGYRVLDIGCGTGLFGPLIREFSSTLIGVDLSSGMLDKARERDVYDDLVESELTRYMQKSIGKFDVISCVDTLVYLGDLADVVPAAYHALDGNGWFFFTVETHSEDEFAQGYWLQANGRYSHSRLYLSDLLAKTGFEVDTMDKVILRKEGREEVGGLLVAAMRND